jgi:hypothetical protein
VPLDFNNYGPEKAGVGCFDPVSGHDFKINNLGGAGLRSGFINPHGEPD